MKTQITRLLAATTLSALMLAPCALAQAAPTLVAATETQAALAPPIYTPTSLVAEPGLPRTPDGRPDFQDVIWATEYFGMIEAVPMMLPPELVLSEDKAKVAFDKMMAMFFGNPASKASFELDPEAGDILANLKGFPVVRGERRSRLVVLPANGKIPFTPEARKEASSGMTRVTKSDHPEERGASERCTAMGGQAPIATLNPFQPRRIVQAPGHLLVHTEWGDEARAIPFSDRHGPADLRAWMGDAIARWDGDTLVIETTNFAVKDHIRGAMPVNLLVTPDSKVIERYTRVSQDELLYQFTIEDPKLYTAPWLAEYSLFRAPFLMYPSSCHEANYGLANILSGQRVADRKRDEAFVPNDLNRDGKLDKAEYATLLASLGFANQLETLFRQRDADKDGFVTAQEYTVALPQ